MSFIKHYLNGAYGLKQTFWAGLVLTGLLLTIIAKVMYHHAADALALSDTFFANSLLLVMMVIGFVIIALAVGVIFASFHNRTPGFSGWLAIIIACAVIIANCNSIISTATTMRTGTPAHGLHRHFAHWDDDTKQAYHRWHKDRGWGWRKWRHAFDDEDDPFAELIDQLLADGDGLWLVVALNSRSASQQGQGSDAADLAPLTSFDDSLAEAFCHHLPFLDLPAIAAISLTLEGDNGSSRGFTISKEDCERQ